MFKFDLKSWNIILFILCCFLLDDSNCASNKLLIARTELTNEETVLKWRNIEKNMKEMMENVIKQALPLALRASSELEVSSECTGDLLKVVIGVRDLKMWAIQLLDATGKPSAGILKGTIGSFGNYEQCLDVVFPGGGQEKTTGQHCFVELSLPLLPRPTRVKSNVDIFTHLNVTFDTEFMNYFKILASGLYSTSPKIAVCIPSTCSKSDLQKMVDFGISNLGIYSKVTVCETKQPKTIDTTQWAIISVFAIIILLNVSAAILEISTSVFKFKIGPLLTSITTSCSPLTNFVKTMDLKTKNDGNIFESLNGIKCLSLTWIITSHMYITSDFADLRGVIITQDYRVNYEIQALFNGYPAVDSFFVLTGVIVAYHLVKYLDEKGPRAFNAWILILRRILRLLPSVMLMAGMIIVFPLLGSGPVWSDTMDYHAHNCRERWWTLPLFISNFYLFPDSCILQGWYVSVEIQSFLLIMVYFVLLTKFRNTIWSKIYLGFLIIFSMISTGIVTYILDLPPTGLLLKYDLEYLFRFMRIMYTQVYSHIGPYAIGIALGQFLAKGNKIKIKTRYLVLGWIIATLSALTIIYSIYPWTGYIDPTPIESIAYASLHRNAWALCLCWVIFVCAIGKGGIINDMLSWSGFKPFTRVSYLIYLNHYIIISSYWSSRKGQMDFDNFTMVWLFFGNLTACFFVAVGMNVLFEAPLNNLERNFFASLMRKKTPGNSKVEVIAIETVKNDVPQQETNENN